MSALNIDQSWTSASVPLRSGTVDAFYRQLTSEERQTDFWQVKYSESVVSQGGMLVTRLRDSIRYESGLTPRGAKMYKSILVPSELWYFPRCGFEESIQCLQFLGFAGSKGSSNPGESIERVRKVLERIAVNRLLTMDRVSSTTAQFKLAKGPLFIRKEMVDVLKFNETEFAASREQWEHREYIKAFLAHQFFVLGSF